MTFGFKKSDILTILRIFDLKCCNFLYLYLFYTVISKARYFKGGLRGEIKVALIERGVFEMLNGLSPLLSLFVSCLNSEYEN